MLLILFFTLVSLLLFFLRLGAMSKAGQSARPLSAAEWAAALTVLSQLIRTSAAAVVMHIITFVEISVRREEKTEYYSSSSYVSTGSGVRSCKD